MCFVYFQHDWPFLPPEEAFIREMDGKTGASLKLTILNPKGRVWTMVARFFDLEALCVTDCLVTHGNSCEFYRILMDDQKVKVLFSLLRFFLAICERGG